MPYVLNVIAKEKKKKGNGVLLTAEAVHHKHTVMGLINESMSDSIAQQKHKHTHRATAKGHSIACHVDVQA